MKQIAVLATAIFLSLSFKVKDKTFSGKIIYVNSFVNSKDDDITSDMAPFFGKQNFYFINDSNYKAYNEKNELLYLYNSSTNIYYSCDRNEKTAEKINAASTTSKKVSTKVLEDKETICGFECTCIELKTGSGTTKYFFTPLIRVDKANYSKHSYGDWNACLDATNGGVPLKIVYKDKKYGYTWTCVAKEVTDLMLTDKDFEIPEEIKIKN